MTTKGANPRTKMKMGRGIDFKCMQRVRNKTEKVVKFLIV